MASTRTFREWRRVLRPDGTFVLVGTTATARACAAGPAASRTVLGMSLLAPFSRQLPGIRRSTPRAERLEHLARLLDEGRVRPVVDSTYPLEQVRDAFGRLTSGRAAGRIVLTL